MLRKVLFGITIALASLSILVLSACDEENFVQEVLLWGADGCLGKGEAPEKIPQAVYQVYKKYLEFALPEFNRV